MLEIDDVPFDVPTSITIGGVDYIVTVSLLPKGEGRLHEFHEVHVKKVSGEMLDHKEIAAVRDWTMPRKVKEIMNTCQRA